MIFISMLHQHYVRVSSYITELCGTEASGISSWHMHRTFSQKELSSQFNKYNLNLFPLNNFEIGKVELVLNKLLIYLMALFNNA